MNNNKVIIGVAGRSGGHIIPVLTILQNSTDEWHLLTTTATMDTTITAQAGIPTAQLHQFPLDPIAWRKPWLWLHNIHQLYKVFSSALTLCNSFNPALVISSGGLLALPVSIAAWWRNIPVELWVLDAVPGMAARAIMPFATKVYIVFAAAAQYCPPKKTVLSRYPIRQELITLPTHDQACKELGLDAKLPTLLVLGGSQGSRQLNKLVIATLEQYPELTQKIQIIHQTGNDEEMVRLTYERLECSALVFSYRADMANIYATATMAIARAGAGTIAELLHAKIPSLLIPLITSTTSHQQDNAQSVVQEHPALFELLKQEQTTPNALYRWLTTKITLL